MFSPGAIAISAPQDPAVAAVLSKQAERLETELRWVDPLLPPSAGGPRLGLAGELQRRNGAVAAAMADVGVAPAMLCIHMCMHDCDCNRIRKRMSTWRVVTVCPEIVKPA